MPLTKASKKRIANIQLWGPFCLWCRRIPQRCSWTLYFSSLLTLTIPDTDWLSLRASLYAAIRASPVWFQGKLGTHSPTPKHTILFNNYAYMWLRTSLASKDFISIEKWQVSCKLPIFLGKLPYMSFPPPKQTKQLEDQDHIPYSLMSPQHFIQRGSRCSIHIRFHIGLKSRANFIRTLDISTGRVRIKSTGNPGSKHC